MMPTDSVHSTIESYVRRRTILAPSESLTTIHNARTNPMGYIHYYSIPNRVELNIALFDTKSKSIEL